jgi:hypothetical protein
MRLGLISDHPPAQAACELLAAALQAQGSEATLLCPEPPRNRAIGWLPQTPEQAAVSELLHQFDAVGVFVETEAAAELRRIHRRAAALRQRSPVPLFSGPVRPLCGDALSADLLPRLDFELLCLQGEAQHEHLRWLLQNGTPTEQPDGAPAHVAIGLWCLPSAPIGHSPSQERLLVVLDEPQIPPSPFANGVLLERLMAVAKDSPHWQIRLQPDAALPADPEHWPQTSLAWHYRQQPTLPANLQLGAPEELAWAVTQASACLGIGSDWLLPPMVWGKPTVVLGDYGIRTDFNGPLFFGSGLMHRLSDCLPLDRLLSLPGANPAWLDSLGWAIADGPQRLLRALEAVITAARGHRP